MAEPAGYPRKFPVPTGQGETVSVEEALKQQAEIIQASNHGANLVELAAASVEHLEAARSAFREDVRSIVTLICAFYIGLAALLAFAAPKTPDPFTAFLVTIAALALLGAFVFVQRAVARKALAAYEYYVAAALYAKVVHAGAGLGSPHQWFLRIDRIAREKGNDQIPKERLHAHLTQEWMLRDSDISFDGAKNLRVSLAELVYCSLAMLFIAALLTGTWLVHRLP